MSAIEKAIRWCQTYGAPAVAEQAAAELSTLRQASTERDELREKAKHLLKKYQRELAKDTWISVRVFDVVNDLAALLEVKS